MCRCGLHRRRWALDRRKWCGEHTCPGLESAGQRLLCLIEAIWLTRLGEEGAETVIVLGGFTLLGEIAIGLRKRELVS